MSSDAIRLFCQAPQHESTDGDCRDGVVHLGVITSRETSDDLPSAVCLSAYLRNTGVVCIALSVLLGEGIC